ncbi:MAG: potassium channel family protein [Pseudolabrys sp.]
MLRQFLFGGAVSICNIAVHALITTVVVRIARTMGAKELLHPYLVLVGVMISTVSVLMITHAFEVGVWALAYSIVDIAPPGSGLMYFAFVNYTTLGYGDIVPTRRWQLLGPMTAMNGVLLFGWSTALIFEVLRRAMAR